MTAEAQDAPDEGGVPCMDLERREGIATTRRTLRKPASHGLGGQFVINDAHRPASDLGHVPEYRNFPDGSAHQHARAAWYAGDVDAGEPVVLSTNYNPAWSDRDEEVAVVLTPSRSHAGTGQGEDYSAWYKYDLKLVQLDDDGEPTDRTPAESLNLKLYPQVEGLVTSEGEPLELPHGPGTRVQYQTTWAESTDEAVDRATDLLEHALGYDADRTDVNPDSVGVWKAETHLRFAAERTDDVVHTVRQTVELLARNQAEVEDHGHHDGQRWLEIKIEPTEGWDRLGFPDVAVPIQLKVYYPQLAERAPYPLNQPKIEAAVAGKEQVRNDEGELVRRAVPGDRVDEVLGVLRELVCAHLVWADVEVEDLVADDFLDGAAGEPYDFLCPQGRREWLRDHYESLIPDLYREVTKYNTDVLYDMLSVLSRRGSLSYDELAEATGSSKRNIRYHVSRLEQRVGGDGPGLVTRVTDACTFVALSSRALEERVREELNHVKPGDTIEDERERAEQRRQEREQRREDDGATEDEDVDDVAEGDQEGELWVPFPQVDLSPEQLAVRLKGGRLDEEDVRVNVGPYDWVGPG